MPQNWKTYKLGDLIEYQKGYAFKSKWYQDTGRLIVRVSDTTENSVSIEGCHRISDETAESLLRYELQENDIVIASVGSWPPNYSSVVGKVVKIPRVAEGALLNQNAVRLRSINKEVVDQRFIYDTMKTGGFLNYIINRAQGSASQASIKLTDIFDFELQLPPLPEQTAIASILSTIDAKIENNLAINKTLEEMAMALYKEWFVDFGPFQDGKFVDSELGMIPEGWEVKRLQAFANLIMGQSPKSIYYNNEKVGLPFHQGVTNYGIRFPQDETFSTEGKRLAAQGDILFSVRAPVGRINICKNKIVLGRGIASIRFEKFNHFMFYALKNMFLREDIIGSGTVFNSVNKNDIQSLEFIIPPEEILLDFEEKAKKLDEKYYNNYKQNQSLTTLRDTLLPKLISGEVRLNEFANR